MITASEAAAASAAARPEEHSLDYIEGMIRAAMAQGHTSLRLPLPAETPLEANEQTDRLWRMLRPHGYRIGNTMRETEGRRLFVAIISWGPQWPSRIA